MIWQGQQVNEADLPDEADKAKANEADEAKAYKADKAIVANAVNEANVAKEVGANVINKIVVVNKATLINKVIVVDEATLINKAIVANEAKANKAIWFCHCCLYGGSNRRSAGSGHVYTHFCSGGSSGGSINIWGRGGRSLQHHSIARRELGLINCANKQVSLVW